MKIEDVREKRKAFVAASAHQNIPELDETSDT